MRRVRLSIALLLALVAFAGWLFGVAYAMAGRGVGALVFIGGGCLMIVAIAVAPKTADGEWIDVSWN